ncbi:MAG: major capsid protein [Ktedonobacteraceae bacterium]
MTIASNSVTLADYALTSNSDMVRAVTYSLIDYGNVIQDVPLIEKKTLIANGVRFEGNLPTVNWSQLNAEGVTTKGTPTPYQEQVFLVRNYIDVDKLFVEEENAIVNPRAVQEEAYLKSLTYDMNFKFFQNNHITGDANAPVGLAYRIANGGTFGVRPENLIDAGGVDLSTSGLTATTANNFIEFLDQLLWSVDSINGEGVVIYLNEVMQRRFAKAVRIMGTSGGFTIMQDQFNRTIQMYKGAIVRDPGYKQDQSTRIITTTETAAGTANTGGTFTSIYAVNYGTDHFFGWQFEPPNVLDLGLINNGVIYRTVIDWAIGFMNASTRSIGRLYDIKLA